MTWNPPSDVISGDNLTATLWNNQLGANGSLQFAYNQYTTTQLKRNIVLYKSTNTVFGAAGNLDIAFDTIITNYGNQQLNFPVTVPITDIPLPTSGVYLVTHQFRCTTAIGVRSNFSFYVGSAGQVQYTFITNSSVAANVLFTHTVLFYAPLSSKLKLNTMVTAAGTITAALPSSTDGSQVVTITRI
jgi:hypothetical protein